MKRNVFGANLVFWMVYIKDIDRLIFLLEMGANPNISTYVGEYPLHIAAMNNNVKIIEVLLEYKADINAVNIFLETPLSYALRHNSKEAISLLENKGADRKKKIFA